LLGVEYSIASKAAVRKSLRIIFERVGRRFHPHVIHRQILIFLDQHELNVRAHAFDRSRLHIAGHP
jgi:hypothetical protein